MTTSLKSAGQANKVVVAYLDGRRVKGFVFNFSAMRDAFSVFPGEDARHEDATEVKMAELKAVFFVKDFVGHPEHHESSVFEHLTHGRRIEVTFSDGEKITGTTEGYNSQKLGFFMFPADPQSNNIRLFAVNRSVRQVRFL